MKLIRAMRKVALWGSESESGVTMAGPMGAKVSKVWIARK